MDLHEYQAKEILKGIGVPVPPFVVVSSVNEVEAALDALGPENVVLKAQVHAGGRGKAGGVRLVSTRSEALSIAKALLGSHIVTGQTSSDGLPINKLLITPQISIKKEYYLGATIDRKRAAPTLIVSKEGGVDIEEVAKENREKLGIFPFLFDGRIRDYQIVSLAKFLGWEGEIRRQGIQIVKAICRAFVENDARLLEINPLIESKGELMALDAKLSLDESALFRHPHLASLFDPSQLAENEVKAFEAGLSYVTLDGKIGCLVNGAGLAMATMDLLLSYGGKPANFLDIGGNASKETIAFGFQLILLDPKVKAIFINIFGGIVDCAVLAQAIIESAREINIKIPVVIRLEGTHAEEGREHLRQSGMPFKIISDLSLAAQNVCKVADGHSD